MDLFEDGRELFSFEAKQKGGFGKGGEKNFEGAVTDLQMQTYLVIRDFQRRTNKAGLPYGWPIAVYTMPETVWGYDLLSSAYGEMPEASKAQVYGHLQDIYPVATAGQIRKLLK